MSDVENLPWAITPEKVKLVVNRLIEAGRPRRIILFGSYVRGTTHRDSDLDVLVVANNGVESTRKEGARLRRALRGIRMCLDILVVREGDLDRLKDQIGLIYREALQHGSVVYDIRQAQ